MSKRKTDPSSRRQADLISVRALADLLRRVAAEPAPHARDQGLGAALRSQGALAKFAVPDAAILAMSLNHQRLIAELALGSYQALDTLRRGALESLRNEVARAKRGNAKTKLGLLARVRELTSEVELLKQDLALLQRAYDLRCLQARAYAKSAGPAFQALCAKEQKELDVTFSLRRKPLIDSKVIDLEEARSRVRSPI